MQKEFINQREQECRNDGDYGSTSLSLVGMEVVKQIPKIGTNSRYTIHVNQDDASSGHKILYEVYWESYSPTYGWRKFYLIDSFEIKEEAESFIEGLLS